MSYTLYDGPISLAKDTLRALVDVLKIAQASPQAASLPEARIHEDMLPLTFQVHCAADLSQKLVARLSGTEPLTMERDLATFDDMLARVAHAQGILDKADKDLINGRTGETVTVGLGPGKSAQVPAVAYANTYALPNIFFHVVTAYDILRKEGVQVGKMNFLAAFKDVAGLN